MGRAVATATDGLMDPTAFNEALWKQDAATVARLVTQIEPNTADRFERMPLAMAAQYGDVAIVRKLIERGARVDGGRTWLTPLAYAARRGTSDIVQTLVDAGATASVVASIFLGDVIAVSRAEVSTVDEEGTPLLLHASESLRAEMVDAFVGDVQVTDRFGETALHRIADLRRADPRIVQIATLLLDRGAVVDARNRDQVTPLHQAVRARNFGVTELLLARGADANAADKRGSTPLHRAVASTGAGGTAGSDGRPFVAALLAHGANPDQADSRGRSARAAAKRGVF